MMKLLRSLLTWLRLLKPEQKRVLATVFYLDASPGDVAAFIREKRLVVQKIRCKTHAMAPKIAPGYLTFYDLVCKTEDGREHHVYVWQDTATQQQAPFLFRMELKFAEPAYFSRIGLPGITILDPGETGKDEDEFVSISYHELLCERPLWDEPKKVIEIPETDEDLAMLDQARRVNMEMFRVKRQPEPAGPEVVMDHMPIAPLDMQHKSME